MSLAEVLPVDWPKTPVERLRAFRPPFCPWPACPEHRRREPGFRFHRIGSYSTARGRRVPRYRCLHCRRVFSRQSFALSYYMKRPELSVHIAAGIVAGGAHRQIARSLGCAPSTVTRQAARLGRHTLLLLARALQALGGSVHEPLAADHFETFEFSQDLPFGVMTVVGRESWFVYALDPAPHARTGRRTEAQEQRRLSRPRRSRRGGYAGSFARTLDTLAPLVPRGRRLVLACDGKAEYPRAIERHPLRRRIRIECHPNPKRGPKGSPRTAAAIARDRAMFAVDQLHGLIRHSVANHRRETIAFGRRLNAILERLFLMAAWKNFVKGRSERRPDPTTPAMHLGLADTPWSWPRVFARRLFPGREALPGPWREIYLRDWVTPVLRSNQRHRLKHAA